MCSNVEGPSAPASSARQSAVLASSAGRLASFVTWGVGWGQSVSSSVGGQTSGPTRTAHQVCCHQAPIGPERFDLPPTPFADANIGAETLQAMKLRWVTSMQPSSRGTARSEMSASMDDPLEDP